MTNRVSLLSRMLLMDLPNCVPFLAGGLLCLCGLMLNAVATFERLDRLPASGIAEVDLNLFWTATFGNLLLVAGIVSIVGWIRHLQRWYGFAVF